MARSRQEKAQTLESGDIFFFYRPRIEEREPGGRRDLQRFYMVLKSHERQRFRLAVIGRKQLPDPGRKGERLWGFIDLVRKDPEAIRRELQGETYETATRGERRLPQARPAGEGVYHILRHGDHTHLAYALELPKEPGEVQEELRIGKEGSFIISVKNPERPSPPGVGLGGERQAEFPQKLLEVFAGRKFADVDPPEFLDHEGAEFLLISAAEDVKEELGIELEAEEESESSAEIFRELHISRQNRPTAPLLRGEWE